MTCFENKSQASASPKEASVIDNLTDNICHFYPIFLHVLFRMNHNYDWSNLNLNFCKQHPKQSHDSQHKNSGSKTQQTIFNRSIYFFSIFLIIKSI